MEVAQVISAIVDQAKVSLGHVDPTGVSPELASVHDKLRRLIERTEREVVEAYKRAVLPKRVGMFANALAHHDASAAPAGAPSAHALLCMTCGAPRLSDADFSCPFCNQHMAKPEHP